MKWYIYLKKEEYLNYNDLGGLKITLFPARLRTVIYSKGAWELLQLKKVLICFFLYIYVACVITDYKKNKQFQQVDLSELIVPIWKYAIIGCSSPPLIEFVFKYSIMFFFPNPDLCIKT